MYPSKRSLWPFALAPLALAASVSHSAALSASAVTWADTDTKAVSLPGMTDTGTPDASRVIPLMVALRLQNRAALDTYFRHITTVGDPLYKHYLGAEEFASVYGPSMSQASAVIDYLTAQGFTDIELSPNRTQIRMRGTVAQAQTAFNTEIHTFDYQRKAVIANVTPAQVPAAFGDLVLGVVGLNTVPSFHRNAVQKVGAGTPTTPPSGGFSPQAYQKAYDAGNTSDGSKTTIAIMADGDLSTVIGKHPNITDPNDANFDKGADLRLFEKAFGLPYVPVTIVQTGYDTSDTGGAVEYDLDTQTSTGIAGGVKRLYVYDGAQLSDLEVISVFNHFATDNIAQAGSASFGECEVQEQAFGVIGVYDQIFLQAATQGQTLFASTGDTGSACMGAANGVPAAGVQGVEFPASSTYIVGVGGTNLTVDSSGNYATELAWEGGGGGVSMLEKAGSWQASAVPLSASGFKGIPDVAMAGGELSPGTIYAGGSQTSVAGTSLASPLALGVWARLQSSHVTPTSGPNPLGFAAPDLYALAPGPAMAATGFNDITMGSNGAYQATPGYDYTTGLGTFDIAKVNAALQHVAFVGAPAPALGGDVCAVPGYKVSYGTVGSNADAVAGMNAGGGQQGHNVLAAYISEHYNAANKADGFTFSLDAGSLSTTSASNMAFKKNVYFVYFTTPDGIRHYVAYEVTADPQATTPTNFTYGHVVTKPTPPPVGSGDIYDLIQPVQEGAAAGTINGNQVQIFVPRSALPTVKPGVVLDRIFAEVDTETLFLDQAQDALSAFNSTSQGRYTPDEIFHCVPAPTAVLTTVPGLDKSGTTVTVNPGDTVTFDASKSAAAGAAAGETVTTYTFDFGDGQTVSGQGATAKHTYTAGGSYIASVKVTDSAGKVSTNTAQQSITVAAPPITPFGFSERKNVPDSTFVTSEPVTIAGTAGQSYRISVESKDSMQYSINGGAFTATPGVISVGDTLVVRHLSAATDNTSETTAVTIGNFTAGFKSTTGTTVDMTPDAFGFGETDNVMGGMVQTSKAVVPANYDTAPVVAGPGMSYSISGGKFTSANGTINKGQSITARLTSSAGSLVYTRGYIAIGGVKGYFTTRNASSKK